METKEILKQLRESKGFTIQDVAKKIGMQYTMCREYETGIRNLGMSAAIKFADFYGVSIDYLVGRTTVKQMATEQPDPFAEIDVSVLEKRIIKKYTELDETTRTLCIELFRQLSPVFDVAIQELANKSAKTSIQQSPPQPIQPPAVQQSNPPKSVEPPPKSDIQISQMRNSEFAIARGGNGMYKPLPTDEQMESFKEVTPDMI